MDVTGTSKEWAYPETQLTYFGLESIKSGFFTGSVGLVLILAKINFNNAWY